jgi:TRAP-type C4-dicarboxylate transport system permease small subunit
VSHGIDLGVAAAAPVMRARNPLLARLQSLVSAINTLVLRLAMVVLVLTSCVLTYSVVTRYFLKSATDWQDEVAVFLLVGATFMTTAHVQSLRGHVGIEALTGLLPPAVNRVRAALVDWVAAGFCVFFTWKSWSLLHEAWTEGQTTSSSFGAPLWIPYALMTLGMALLTLQLVVQSLVHVTGGEIAGDAK